MINLRLFGSPQGSLDGERIKKLRSTKTLALLAYLVVESDRPHQREKLAGMLWPGFTDSSARGNLRRVLVDLRVGLGERRGERSRLQASRQTIRFNPDHEFQVDVTTFTTYLGIDTPAGGSPDFPSLQEDSLKQALQLYRGPFLDGFSLPDGPEFETWVVHIREWLQRLAGGSLQELADRHENRHQYGPALNYARRLLELDPWRESVWQQTMRLLALDGRRDAALMQYEEYRQALSRELEAEPCQDTQELWKLIREDRWPERERDALPPYLTGGKKQTGRNPYRGLSAFREEDADHFYGREHFTLLLERAFKKYTFLAVTGPSGAGKTSAVCAGWLPRLREQKGRSWQIIFCRPQADPFCALSAAVLSTSGMRLSGSPGEDRIRELAASLRTGDRPLISVLEEGLAGPHQQQGLFVVVDQFEELYTQCQEPSRRRDFLDRLLSAVDMAGRQPDFLKVLIILRADFMGQALSYQPLAEVLQDRTLMLGPMSRDELRAAIVKPAQSQGVAFQPGLAERILEDVGQEPGTLPLLEFALTLLWEWTDSGQLRHETYDMLGGVEGALARYAEQVYGDLTGEEQKRMSRVMTQLVQPGAGTGDTRRVATRAEIGEKDWPLAQHLADRRLVVAGANADETECVELAHEVLIQHWERFQGWLNKDRAFRIWQEGMRSNLRQWLTSGEENCALLRGLSLTQAESWLRKKGEALNVTEERFIRSSITARKRREAERQVQERRQRAAERRSRRLLGVLTGVFAAATLVSLFLVNFALGQRRQAREAYSLSLTASAREVLQNHDTRMGLSLALAANQMERPPDEATRILLEAAYAPGARRRIHMETFFEGLGGAPTALDISQDGRLAVAGLADGGIFVWDPHTLEERLHVTGHNSRVNDIAISLDGLSVLSGSEGGEVFMWDLGRGEILHRLRGHAGAVHAVDYSPDGRYGVSGGVGGRSGLDPGELILWDLDTGQEIHRFVGHVAGVLAAQFTPDSRYILASSGNLDSFFAGRKEWKKGRESSDLILWDRKSGEKIWETQNVEDVYDLDIRFDGAQALTASVYNNSISLWNLKRGQKLGEFEIHQDAVTSVAFTPDGRQALSGSWDESLILWDLDEGREVARLTVHNSDVLDLAVTPDGDQSLSISSRGEMILSDLRDAGEMDRFTDHTDPVYAVEMDPEGRYLLSVSGVDNPGLTSEKATIRRWNLETGKQVQVHRFPFLDTIFQVAVGPGGKRALVAGSGSEIIVWDLESWQEVGLLSGHDQDAWITAVVYSPDGQQALSSSTNGTLILWDVPAKRIIHRMEGYGTGVWALAVSPDGDMAVSDSDVSSFTLWNLKTGKKVREFVRPFAYGKTGSTDFAFIPGEESVISCERDGYLIEWDLVSGAEVRRLGVHTTNRTRLALSLDGRFAVTGGEDGSLMLWDVEEGQLVRRYETQGAVHDVAIAPDGRSAVFGTSGGVIIRWRLSNPSLGEVQTWIEDNRYLPELTCEERERYRIEPLCASQTSR